MNDNEPDLEVQVNTVIPPSQIIALVLGIVIAGTIIVLVSQIAKSGRS